MTPQILLNGLNNGYLGLEMIALIIMDEAHHARKNHPYNHIMEVYRHERDKGVLYDLPKIFGMTASPGASSKGEV
jgi:endoribonuclease Dicer